MILLREERRGNKKLEGKNPETCDLTPETCFSKSP